MSAPVVTRTSSPTLTAVELDRDETLCFVRADGAEHRLTPRATGAEITETNLPLPLVEQRYGKTNYRFWCELEVDGEVVRLEREVATQASFYEPWRFGPLCVWLDAVDDIFSFLLEAHGACRPRKQVRLAVHEADRGICPVKLHPWCPLPAGGLRVEQCYNGEDVWMGAYYGAAAHGGLDLNHPPDTPLWTPLPIDEHYCFNSLTMGHNNNRWRGLRRWPDGQTWILQVHHVTRLTVPSYEPLAVGVRFADAAGVNQGAHPHSHFVFKVQESPWAEPVLLDPWILFRQMYQDLPSWQTRSAEPLTCAP